MSAHKERLQEPFLSLFLPQCFPLIQPSQISFELSCMSHVKKIRFGFTLRSKALSQFRVCLHVQYGAPSFCILRRYPGAVQCTSLAEDAWSHMFSYFTLALRQKETVAGPFGTRYSPAELNRLLSQAPVTGNLTQITKGSSDCI